MKKLIGIIAFISVIITAFSAFLYKKYLCIDRKRGMGFCGKLPEENRKWLEKTVSENLYMVSRDGYCLHGALFNNGSDDLVILVHGYDAEWKDMYTYIKKYYDKGMDILVIDQRGYGLSGDKETTMGHLEKYDVADWAGKMSAEHGYKNIVLHGVSMGAATVMLASAEDLPECVRCVVEDCGYSAVREEFEHTMGIVLHLPPYPVLWITDLITRAVKGWSLIKDADCVKAVRNAKIPICFIHGKKDNFVPYRMLEKLYNACPRDDKELLSVDDADHTEAVVKAPGLYWDTVFGFMKKHFV